MDGAPPPPSLEASDDALDVNWMIDELYRDFSNSMNPEK